MVTMPPSVRVAWENVLALYGRWREAMVEAKTAETVAHGAVKADRKAAADAEAKGKPIPAPTVEKRRADAAAARRKMNALADLAVSAEREFQREAEQHRAGWREAARQPTEDALAEALGALDVLTDSATRLADLNAVWSWLTKARDLSRAPGSRTANLKPLRDVRGALTSLAPTTTEEQWAGEEEKAQALADELERERSRQRVSFRT